MPNWREEYLANIQNAEQSHTVNNELIDACSQLVDRVSVLEAELALLRNKPPADLADPYSDALHPAGGVPRQEEPGTGAATPGAQSPSPPQPTSSPSPSSITTAVTATRLRLELSEALRAKGQLASRLKTAEDELARLRARGTAEGTLLREAEAARRALAVKLRDREEELRAKTKMVEDVHDELAVLHLQLNVVEQKRAETERDNTRLVERLMRRFGEEADAVNMANELVLTRQR